MRILLFLTIFTGSLSAFGQRYPYPDDDYYPRRAFRVDVRGQGYYPDYYTAQAICEFNGYYRAVGFTQWKQAGDKIEGLRSFDGSPFFQVYKWGGGMAIDAVSCQ